MWNITRVTVRFNLKSVDVTDRAQIHHLRNALMKGNRVVDFITAGASHKFTLTFHKAIGIPIVIECDLDEANFGCPSINKSFEDKGEVFDLASEITGFRFPMYHNESLY